MSKLILTDIANLQNEATVVSTLAANNAATKTALENTLSRDGTSPNTMNANLDMNSFRIINLPAPASDTEPARKYDVNNLTSVTASSFYATSSTSMTIGTGSKVFTIESGKAFQTGQFITIASTASPSSYMHGQVISLVGQTLTVNVTDIGGTGTHADWSITMAGTQANAGTVRHSLTTSVTVNISTTGNDSIDWINNQSSSFATRAGAYAYFAKNIDLAGYTVTFQCAAGTYTDSLQAYGPLVGQQGASSVIFKGDSTTPSNVVITPSIAGYCFGAFYGAMYTVDGFKLSMNPAFCQDTVSVCDGAFVIYQNIEFGYNRNPFNHISCALNAVIVNGGLNYITATSVTTNLTTTSGSTAATVSSASNLYAYLGIECTSVAAGTYITAINGTNVTLSRPATATGTNSANFWSGGQCHILLGQTSTYYDLASGSTDGQIIGVTGKPMFVDGFINNNGGQLILQYVGIASNFHVTTGNITASSSTITVADATGLTTGMQVYSSAIQWGSTISSIVGTTITITGGTATTTVNGVRLCFGNPATAYGPPLVNAGPGYVNFATDIITANGLIDPKYLPGDRVTTTNTSFTAGYPSITVTSGEAAAITALFTYFPSGKGLMIFGPGIPVGTVIPDSSYISGTSIYLSNPTYSTQSNVSLTIGGFQWNGARYIVYNDKPISVSALPITPYVVNANIQAGTWTTADANVSLWSNTDNTKLLKFSAGSITAGQTRTLTAPDANTTIVGTDVAQTLTNKTLTNPIVSGKITGTNPTRQVFTSGSGTYTTPTNCVYIEVEMVGAGGGGGGSGTSPGTGGTGGTTTFGTSLLTCNGGGGGASSSPSGGAGGTATGGDTNITGGIGEGGSATAAVRSGNGGHSKFFGGTPAPAYNGNAGLSSPANTGAGASGASSGSGPEGAGGGGGGWLRKGISSPNSTYSYAVGTGGTAGTAGTGGFAGGTGGSGIIIVTEYYGP